MVLALSLVAAFAAPAPRAEAAVVICQRKAKLRLRVDACKSKETQVDAAELGVTGPAGAAGTAGEPGTPGELRIYGDGSAGALAVTGDQQLTDLVPDGNLQLTTVTIAVGATLRVPSGTVIRCSQTFVNDGTVVVATAASAGFADALTAGQVIPRQRAPHPGLAGAPAGQPGATGSTGWEAGGSTGLLTRARFLLPPGPYGGGGGFSGPRGGGPEGGGSFTVLARDDVANNGAIEADGGDAGDAGASGAGGGFVVLASRTAIVHAAGATISAHGGTGANAGAVDVDGGAGGSAGTLTLRATRVGGAGGGASCGSGGNGGRIPVGSPTAEAGGAGQLFVTLADPTALF